MKESISSRGNRMYDSPEIRRFEEMERGNRRECRKQESRKRCSRSRYTFRALEPWYRFVLYSEGSGEPLGEMLWGGQVGCPLDLGTWRSLVTQ